MSGDTVDDEVLARLFEPCTLGSLALRNRMMMTTHGPRLSPRRYRGYLRERSAEVALVGVFASYGVLTFPLGPGRFVPEDHLDFDVVPPHPLTDDGRRYLDGLVPMMAEQAEVVHDGGARIVGQLLNLGGSQHDENFQPALAPTALRNEYRRAVPHALTRNDIADLVAAFGEAAGRVVRAGYDAVELAAGHGYLFEQFLSPLTNDRDDDYGGSAGNRARFLFEVLDAVREATGDGFPVGVRISGAQRAPGGLDNDDMCALAGRLGEWGVAYVNVSGGTYTGLQRGLHQAYVAPPSAGEAPNAADAAAIRAAVRHAVGTGVGTGAGDRAAGDTVAGDRAGTGVIVAGRFTDLRHAAQVIADGGADVIGFTRLLIADPAAPGKARRGRLLDVRPCIGCNECHYGRPVTCAVNPAAGKEDELAAHPAAAPLRVLVVGGGPAGMECARLAARRGHRVELVERAPALGGAVALWGTPPEWPAVPAYLEWLTRQLDDLGVTVRLGTELTGTAALAAEADVVVVAAGADEQLPAVPGIDGAGAVTISTALADLDALGEHVVVVGGLEDHLPPLVVANRLAATGRRVTLLAEPMVAGEGIEPALLLSLTASLVDRGVDICTLSALEAVDGDEVTVRHTLTGRRHGIGGVHSLVVAGVRRSRTGLAEAVAADGRAVHVIGDGLAPRRLMHATLDGARCATAL